MSGAPWIAGYLLLNLTVIILAISFFGLGRELLELKKTKAAQDDEWPIRNISPGDLLPQSLSHAISEACTATAGFIYCLTTPAALNPNLFSLQVLCNTINEHVCVVLCNQKVAEADLVKAISDLRHVTIVMSHDADQTLGLSANVLLYMKDKRVIDATSQSYTPLTLKDRFYFLA